METFWWGMHLAQPLGEPRLPLKNMRLPLKEVATTEIIDICKIIVIEIENSSIKNYTTPLKLIFRLEQRQVKVE